MKNEQTKQETINLWEHFKKLVPVINGQQPQRPAPKEESC